MVKRMSQTIRLVVFFVPYQNCWCYAEHTICSLFAAFRVQPMRFSHPCFRNTLTNERENKYRENSSRQTCATSRNFRQFVSQINEQRCCYGTKEDWSAPSLPSAAGIYQIYDTDTNCVNVVGADSVQALEQHDLLEHPSSFRSPFHTIRNSSRRWRAANECV